MTGFPPLEDTPHLFGSWAKSYDGAFDEGGLDARPGAVGLPRSVGTPFRPLTTHFVLLAYLERRDLNVVIELINCLLQSLHARFFAVYASVYCCGLMST